MQTGVHTGQVPVQAGTEGWLSWDQCAAAQETRANVATDGRRRRSTAGVLPTDQGHVRPICGWPERNVEGGGEGRRATGEAQVLTPRKVEPKQAVLWMQLHRNA